MPDGRHAAVGTAEVVVLPVSFAQERLWLVERLRQGSTELSMPATVRLRGRLDRQALWAALAAVVDRHEVLRTTFGVEDGRPVQWIHDVLAPACRERDLSELPETERAAALDRLSAAEVAEPFDLARGPLVRALLARLSDEDHVLLLNLHHAVADGWSVGVLVDELSAFYAGRSAELPELPIQYADYAVWQREWAEGPEAARLLEHWRGRLAGAGSGRLLDADGEGPAAAAGSATRTVVLAAARSRAVRELAQRHRATPFMVLLAAFELLLARHAGATDVAVGTPVAGRDHRDSRRLIGPFLNTLVLRTDLSGDPTWSELVARVRRTVADAVAHQSLPFEALLGALRPERSLGETPYFQVLFNMLSFPLGRLELPGLQVEAMAPADLAAKFDLSVYAEERDGGFVLRWTWDRSRFSAARIEAMAEQHVALLDRAAAAPEERASRLALRTAEEAARLPRPARLPDRWSGGVHEGFARRAAAAPQSLAVADPAIRWTYGELDGLADRLAWALHDAGVGAEDVVAVYAHRSAPVALAVLGVLKAGGAFLLLDPAYPAARLAACVRAARPRAVLWLAAAGAPPREVEEALAELRPALRLELPEDAAGIAALLAPHPAQPPAVAVGPDHLACLGFTSGSLGRPRAVAGRHGSLSHFLPWLEERLEIGPHDRFCGLSPLAHDPFQRDLFTPLWSGARLLLPPPELLAEPPGLARWLRDAAVTVAHLSPSRVRQLADSVPAGFELPDLRLVATIGEPLLWRDVARLERLAPRVRVLNLYGTTETQRALAWYPVPAGAAAAAGVRPGGTVLAGRGMPGAEVLVLDRAGQPAGAWERGEIVVRSPHLARGYHGDPRATAERFRPDPLAGAGEAGARTYRTGDLGRQRADGAVEVLGRADDQVQVRGHRVEPAEVVAALTSHPAVGQAVVLPIDTADGTGLAAFVVLAGGAAAGREAFLSHLRRLLPAPMVPSALVVVREVPLLPSGKPDRAALVAAVRAVDDAPAAAEPPGSPFEEALAEIWRELLGRDRVGRHEDFLAAGGHSLLAARLAARVRRVFGVELSLRTLFEAPTIAGQARAVSAALVAGDTLPPIVPLASEGEAPLSFPQQRLWFVEQLAAGGARYLVPVALRLDGRLDVGALVAALDGVARRHEVLRTVLPATAAGPVQRVLPAAGRRLSVVDLAALPAARREAAAAGRVAAAARRPFDLAREPAWRALLLRLDERRHVLALVFHHVAVDGWSLGTLTQEIGALYAAAAAGRAAGLPPLPLRYRDFAIWQRRLADDDRFAADLDYWRQQLAGAPEELPLPLDRPRGATGGRRGGALPWRLAGAAGDGLAACGRRLGATAFMTLLAAFQALLGRLGAGDDVVVGTAVAGRPQVELEGLVGVFVNTLPLRSRRVTASGFDALVLQVREVTLAAFSHQGLPFERLVEEVAPERSLARSPLVQATLVLQTVPTVVPELPGLTVREQAIGGRPAKFDLSLVLAPDGDGLAGTLQYDGGLFDATTGRRLLRHLDGLLAAALADPERPIRELPLLTPAERHQVAVEWSHAAAVDPPGSFVGSRVAAAAARRPQAVALRWDGGELTYGELQQRVAALARRLGRAGIGPEHRVGVYAERSPEMVVALLAVLAAGAAYVPLPVDDPPHRLAQAAADAGLDLLLADRPPPPSWAAAAAGTILLGEVGGAEGVAPAATGARAGHRPRAEHPAYVLFTSGSTGRPKGVVVTHGGLAAHLDWIERALPLSAADRLLQKTPIGFDASVWELFAPLAAGACLVLAPPGAHRDPGALAAALRRHRATVVQLVPTQLAALLAEPALAACGELRRVCCGGEALPPSLVDVLSRRLPAAEVVNLYGPTETTIQVLWWRGRGSVRRIPLGRPVDGAEVRVLDPALRPAPIGVAGEIHVGGMAVARGYHAAPAATAARFVPDPFRRGGRLYRTGDLGRQLADGQVEFLGRADAQLKLHGVRVDVAEIEAALVALPGIEAAAVGVVGEGGAGLCAYLVGDGEAEPEMRRRLLERLPPAAVPGRFVRLDALPCLPSGKVDRRALPAPPPRADDLRPPTWIEDLVAAEWRQLLDRDEVRRDDDFFALGGHSLLAARLVARLASAFAVDLPVRAVFEAPTVSGLAARIEAMLGAPPVVPLLRRADRGELPLSSAQERLWFLQRLDPGSPAYNLAAAFRVRGRLDLPALDHAFARLLARQRALRTVFVEQQDRPVGRLEAPLRSPLLRIDLAALPSARREPATLAAAAAIARRPFDLARGPLLRAAVVTGAADDGALLAGLHHIAGDGWSLGLIAREVGALYAAALGGGSEPPEPPVEYADYAAWEARALADGSLAPSLAVWRRRLEGLGQLPPLPGERAGGASDRAAVQPIAFDAAVAAGLREVAHRQQATLYMTLLALFAAGLHAATGTSDVAIGSPVAVRERPELETLVGLFVNTVVLRLDASGDPRFLDLVARAREVALEAFTHRAVPFDRVAAEVRPQGRHERGALFRAWFVLQNTPPAALELPGLRLEPLPLAGAAARHDLKLDLTETAAGIEGFLQVRRERIDRAGAARLAAGLRAAAAAVARRPDLRLAELRRLFGEAARQLDREAREAFVAARSGQLAGLLRATPRRAAQTIGAAGD